MGIKGDGYRIDYHEESSTVVFQGTMRLSGQQEYGPIAHLLWEAAAVSPGGIVLDMRNLEFLNSAGISSLNLFILKLAKTGQALTVLGSDSIPWQEHFLSNCSRLHNGAQVFIE